jgi:hypothetical protein
MHFACSFSGSFRLSNLPNIIVIMMPMPLTLWQLIPALRISPTQQPGHTIAQSISIQLLFLW